MKRGPAIAESALVIGLVSVAAILALFVLGMGSRVPRRDRQDPRHLSSRRFLIVPSHAPVGGALVVPARAAARSLSAPVAPPRRSAESRQISRVAASCAT
jgi:hypothetical protein